MSGRRRSRVSPVAALVLRAIALYQGLRAGRPSPCRYLPTCSAYAAEAVRRHGAGKGILLSVKRLARCHPLCEGGIDPVP